MNEPTLFPSQCNAIRRAGESYPAYRRRRIAEKKSLKGYLRGRLGFDSRRGTLLCVELYAESGKKVPINERGYRVIQRGQAMVKGERAARRAKRNGR
jgi:hypothetical protein